MMKPGDLLIVLGNEADTLEAQGQGLHLRDTLLILFPGPRSLVAFLFRQPLEGTVAENVLKHGCGGLWIDGCRVGYGGKSLADVQKEARSPGKHGQNGRVIYNGGWIERGEPIEFHPLGRWPTNLLLVHGPGCVRVGERVVRGGTGGQDKNIDSGATSGEVYGVFHRRSGIKYALPDGTETVAAWDCQPDCPVRLLDEMSSASAGQVGGNKDPNGSLGYHGGGKGRSTPGVADFGTAGRFYPQFVSLPEALDWLVRLICPGG